MAVKDTTTTNKTTAAKKGPTKADLEAQIAALQAQLLAAQQMAANAAYTPQTQVAPNIVVTAPNTDVTVVYCSDSQGYAEISNLKMRCTRYGESFVMSRSQFDELVGKYRHWFDRGAFAVSSKNIDVAAEKGLRTERELGLDAATLNSIGTMSASQLERLWQSLNTPAQKDSIVFFFKRKFIEGAPGFADREKVDLLNRLTGGGFSREQDELSGRWKIRQTDIDMRN